MTLRLPSRDGRLGRAGVAALVEQHPDARFLVCGPRGFLDTTCAALGAAGVSDNRVHVEAFTPTGDAPGVRERQRTPVAVATAASGWGPDSGAFAAPRPADATQRLGAAVMAGLGSVGRTRAGGLLWRGLGGLDAVYDRRLPVDPTAAAAAFVGRLTPHVLETFATFSRRYAATGPTTDPCEPDGNTFVVIVPAPRVVPDAPIPPVPGLPVVGRTMALHLLRGAIATKTVLENVQTFDRVGFIHHYQAQGVGAMTELPPGHAAVGLASGPMHNNETWRVDRAALNASITAGWLDRCVPALLPALAPVVQALEARAAADAGPFDASVFATRVVMRANLAVLFGLEALDALEAAAMPLWDLARSGRDLLIDASRGLLDGAMIRERRAPVREALADMQRIVRGMVVAGAPDTAWSPLVRWMVDGPADEASVQRLFPSLMAALGGGQEGSGAALAWSLYVLAKQPETLAALVAEVDQWRAIHGDEPVGLVALEERPLTLAFLYEILRLYPFVQQLVRVATRDGEMPPDPETGRGGFRFSTGASFIVYTTAVNRCERWWTDPSRFDVNRFLVGTDPRAAASERGRIVRANARRWEEAGHFLPFGRGPGTCVARGLAQVQGVAFLDAFLSRFEFPLVDPDLDIDQVDAGPPPGIIAMRVRRRSAGAGAHRGGASRPTAKPGFAAPAPVRGRKPR